MADGEKPKSEIIQHAAESVADGTGINALSANLMLAELTRAIIDRDVELQVQYGRFAETLLDQLPKPEGVELSDEFVAGMMYGMRNILLANEDVHQRRAEKAAYQQLGVTAFREQHNRDVHGI